MCSTAWSVSVTRSEAVMGGSVCETDKRGGDQGSIVRCKKLAVLFRVDAAH